MSATMRFKLNVDKNEGVRKRLYCAKLLLMKHANWHPISKYQRNTFRNRVYIPFYLLLKITYFAAVRVLLKLKILNWVWFFLDKFKLHLKLKKKKHKKPEYSIIWMSLHFFKWKITFFIFHQKINVTHNCRLLFLKCIYINVMYEEKNQLIEKYLLKTANYFTVFKLFTRIQHNGNFTDKTTKQNLRVC